jgi:hypothetical protein
VQAATEAAEPATMPRAPVPFRRVP